MYRLFVTAAALWLAAPPALPAVGAPDSAEPRCVVTTNGVRVCQGKSTVSTPGQTGSRPRSGTAAPRDPNLVYVNRPTLSTAPDGSSCVRSTEVSYAPPGPNAVVRGAWGALSAFPLCPGQRLEDTDPVMYAIQFWQEVPLPDPKPFIAPGWAITGKYAYLETRGERQHTYTRDTPFGPLELVATGRYHVDWGDGTTTGPHDVEGRPWPDGQITHTYIDVGTYDVVVTQRWSSTWRIGDASGTLSGLRTEGRIEDFRVEQIQAVVRAEPG